ncbi:MAG: ribonuclease HII [Bryobacterales bacterium]|nr:ribonuclease HII [Bryobacterales bacterium]
MEERRAREQGYLLIAGLDEAGRGCLFGDVYAAAVILPERTIPRGLNDSKQLTPEERESLAPRIQERSIAWAVATASAAEVDRINIYQASRLAMKRALEALTVKPDFLLVDALTLDTLIPQRALIHGDAISVSIAAASILAKTARDRAMVEWDRTYPQYGLARHKGYGTAEHLRALAEHGPTPHHRKSYEPVRRLCPAPSASGVAQEALW